MLFRTCPLHCVLFAILSFPFQAIAAEGGSGDLCPSGAQDKAGKSGVEQRLGCLASELQRIEARLQALEVRLPHANPLHIPDYDADKRAFNAEPKP